jgi:hypothetical protein
MTTPAPPRRPAPLLPNPGITETGHVSCNEPLFAGDQVVGYCERLVRPRRSRWLRARPAAHRGPHRIEWWS